MSNSEFLNKKEYRVKYPKNEKAYVFIPHNRIPFESAVVGITYPTANYEINRKNETRVCLFEYVVSGEGEVFIDGRWQTVSSGEFYILPAGMEHRYRSFSDHPWEKVWINYISDYMPLFLKSYGVGAGIYRSDRARGYFDELIEITKDVNLTDDTPFRIADRVHKIIALAAVRTKGEKDGLRAVLATYVYKKLSLDEMAERLHTSKSNLIRSYKNTYGITPYADLVDMKLEAAMTLLSETMLPIKEIADKLCICDEHYFSSLFFEKTGVRPGKYRKG